MDVSKWPVSNVTLGHPVGMPSDVALLACCDMPPDTPVDGPGLALSMVKFEIWAIYHNKKVGDEVSLPMDGKVRCVFGRKDLTALWELLDRNEVVTVRVTAWPRFYTINEDGGASLAGNDRGYFAGEKIESPRYRLSRNEHGKLTIDGVAEPERPDPGPTAEEQAEIDRSDAQMAAEREAHERREREIRERAARENRENDARIERELAERMEAERRAAEEAEAERRRRDEEMDAERRRAAAERERLSIGPDGGVSKALDDPPSEDSNYLALVNLWNGRYAPHDQDGFKKQLVEIRAMDGMADAVDEVCRRLGWTL